MFSTKELVRNITKNIMHVQYTYKMRFMAIFLDIKRYLSLRTSCTEVWLGFPWGLALGGHCDAYTRCRESHYSGVLNNPHKYVASC